MFDKLFGDFAKQFSGIEVVREEVGGGLVRVRCNKHGFGGEYKLSAETKSLDEFAKAEHAKTMAKIKAEETAKVQTSANLVPDNSGKASL